MRNTCYKLLHGCPLNDRMARVCVFRSYTYYLYECSNQESGMHVISCVLVVQLRQQFCRRVRKKEKTWKCHIGGPAGIACPMLNHFTFNTGREEKGRWNEIVGKRCRLICMAMSSHAACHTHTHTQHIQHTHAHRVHTTNANRFGFDQHCGSGSGETGMDWNGICWSCMHATNIIAHRLCTALQDKRQRISRRSMVVVVNHL